MSKNYNILIPIVISFIVIIVFSYAFLKTSELSIYFFLYIVLITLSIFFVYDAWVNKDDKR
jgi:hypothetical protein